MAFQQALWIGGGSYTAAHDRYFMNGFSMVEGVGSVGGLAITQNGTPNLTFNVAAGYALVQGDDVAVQGLYGALNDATLNKAIVTGAHASLKRLDVIVARFQDSVYLGAGTDRDAMFIDIITGTAQATVDSTARQGAPAIPSTALWLADIIWTAGATTITTGMLTDRRKILGPRIIGEDSQIYRLGVDSSGFLGTEAQ